MKKKNKTNRKDYTKLKFNYESREYYGLFIKNHRVKIDTKRYKKFFALPNKKIERRNTVYYMPSKIHKYDYLSNIFKDKILNLKMLWLDEFSKAINIIKTPKQVEDEVRLNSLMDGILDYDEANITALFASFKREQPYRFVIKSIYAQFFQQMMSEIDALSLRVMVSQGYKSDE